MRKLTQFLDFNPRFFDQKIFKIKSMSPWTEFENKDHILGTKMIAEVEVDMTEYKNKKDDEDDNTMETCNFKFPGVFDFKIKRGTHFRVDTSKIIKSTVWGRFNDGLTVEITKDGLIFGKKSNDDSKG